MVRTANSRDCLAVRGAEHGRHSEHETVTSIDERSSKKERMETSFKSQ